MISITIDKIAQELSLDETASVPARFLANAILLRAIEDDDLRAEHEALERVVESLRDKLEDAERKIDRAFETGRDAVMVTTQIERAKQRELLDEIGDLKAKLVVGDPDLIAKLRRDIRDYQTRETRADTKLAEFRDNNIGLLKDREALVEENDALVEELRLADEARGAAEELSHGLLARARAAEDAHDALQEALKKAQGEIATARVRYDDLLKSRANLQSRVDNALQAQEDGERERRIMLANQRDIEARMNQYKRVAEKLEQTADVAYVDKLIRENEKLTARDRELSTTLFDRDRTIAELKARLNEPENRPAKDLIDTINAQAKRMGELEAKLARGDGFEAASIERTTAEVPVLVACESEVDLLSLRNSFWRTSLAGHLVFRVIGHDEVPDHPLGGIIVMPEQAKRLKRAAAKGQDRNEWLAKAQAQLVDGAVQVTIAKN
ncbi:hypothetical protein CcrC1_gp084 [Caulobacter phage C1]|nr:hypothetical protein CcrC1_gp084 [Caulobacter phage C1]UTU08312.1 hypothetical protein CcrC2_gp084 [Caulobacter phage C2]UTU08833.1 hypothetical protein CcrJ4_gp082 [Caulobacter phage J4]UTU09386.1 hypothetical protein CcrBL47_gp100 [Caulobacter phage BL47]UTU09946.1 golgin subfamily A member2-like protein [Caulobacter phage RB23]WGN96971.1 hypothetical protein [Bertelyvirus sp.]